MLQEGEIRYRNPVAKLAQRTTVQCSRTIYRTSWELMNNPPYPTMSPGTIASIPYSHISDPQSHPPYSGGRGNTVPSSGSGRVVVVVVRRGRRSSCSSSSAHEGREQVVRAHTTVRQQRRISQRHPEKDQRSALGMVGHKDRRSTTHATI